MKRVVGRIGDGADGPRDQPDGLHAGEGDRTGAADPAGELRRRARSRRRSRSRARGGRCSGRRTRPGSGEPPVADEILDARLGLRHGRLQRHPADRANAWDQGVIGRHASARPDAAGARRVGHHQRVGVGHQPHRRLLRNGRVREREADRHPGAFASGQDRALGCRARTSASPRCFRAAPARWARRWRAATGERRSTTWRRTSAGSSPGNFQKWAGRWNEMPVDAHMLIALSAPRPVFITGGTTDQWADPVGEFLATVAAGSGLSSARQEGSGRDRRCRRSTRR